MTRRATSTRRGRGEDAGLSVRQIVTVARTMSPDQITMQAIADRLGVDRKAVNHHVGDREALLALVAMEAFSESFAKTIISPDMEWREACRAYAHGFVDSMKATGMLVDFFRLGPAYPIGMLVVSDQATDRLLSAGFDDEGAARLLALIAAVCLDRARAATLVMDTGQNIRDALLQRALGLNAPVQLRNISRIAAMGLDVFDERQFDIAIEVLLSGAEVVLRPKLRT